MAKLKNFNRAVVIALVLMTALDLWLWLIRPPIIRNFNDCAKHYPVMETFPEQCRTPDGRVFTNGGSAPTAPTGTIRTTINFQTLVTGDSGSEVAAQNLAISSSVQWADIWHQLYRHIVQEPTKPAVDFGKEMTFVAVLGPQPTGGYNIQILGISEDANTRYVQVHISKPGKGCATTQAVTDPATIVKAATTTKTIKFDVDTETRTC